MSDAEIDPATRRPGRPARLSPELVLDAAEALLDGEGVDAVTIRRVADALDVSPMALYRHVHDKDDLLAALIDRLAQRLVRPAAADAAAPRERLLALWRMLYDGLAEHTWLPEVLARRQLMAPSVLWAVEEIHAALLDAGLTLEQAVLAYRQVWQFTLGALLVRAGASQQTASAQAALRGAPDAERFPLLARAAASWRSAHGADTYADDVATLLDALLP